MLSQPWPPGGSVTQFIFTDTNCPISEVLYCIITIYMFILSCINNFIYEYYLFTVQMQKKNQKVFTFKDFKPEKCFFFNSRQNP